MQTDDTQAIIGALDDLLEKERTALIGGDLDVISRSLPEKERLIDALNTSGQREGLIGLQGKLMRNHALLDSAMDGIRSVANRLGALRRVRNSLDTYDESGRRTTIEGFREKQVEKRA